MRLEDLADHLLVQGQTGPMISDVLREYAGQIRRAPDFGRDITAGLVMREMVRLAADLGTAVTLMETHPSKPGRKG